MLIKARKGNTWRVLTTFPCASLKQRCTHPPFCLNFSRSFNIYSVSLSLTEAGHSRDPSEWQENSNGRRQGCFWKKKHMVSRWYLGDSHTRANWDGIESSRWCQALSVFIYSLVCQGGCLVSFYFLSQEVENGLNKAERLIIGILALVRGFTHPKPLWWCTCLTPCHNLGFYFLDEEGVSHLCSTLEMSTADSLVGLWGVLVSTAFLFESLVAQPRRSSNPYHCDVQWQRNGHTGKPETDALNFWMGWAKRTLTCLWGHGLCCCSLSLPLSPSFQYWPALQL